MLERSEQVQQALVQIWNSTALVNLANLAQCREAVQQAWKPVLWSSTQSVSSLSLSLFLSMALRLSLPHPVSIDTLDTLFCIKRRSSYNICNMYSLRLRGPNHWVENGVHVVPITWPDMNPMNPNTSRVPKVAFVKTIWWLPVTQVSSPILQPRFMSTDGSHEADFGFVICEAFNSFCCGVYQ